jgi:type IV pilus assembly protein PilM
MVAGLLFSAVAVIIWLAIYFFYSYSFYRIGKKFGIGSFWEYCIPVHNMILICRCGGISGWNVAGLLIPVVNIYFMIHIWGSVAEKLGKSYWLYGVVTLLATVTVFILAFDNSLPSGYELPKLNDSAEEGPTEATGTDPVKGAKKREKVVSKPDFLAAIGLRKVSQIVGVDIGSTTIKVCTIRSTKNGFMLEDFAMRSYDEDLLSDGNIIDSNFVSQELKKLFAERKVKSKDVACALSSYTVITKKVTIPFLEDAELENTINLEVENVIPFPLKDIYYSYYVMGVDAEKEDMMNVQIVAAKKEIVDGYTRVFGMAGLKLRILDVDVFCITNMIEQIYNPNETSVIAIDVGASVTKIAIVKGTNVEFTREILMGGKSLTSQIEKSLRLTYREAEARKVSDDGELGYLFEDFIFNVSSEISKTINFYTATKPKETIGRVYLTGGSSMLNGLKEKIEEDTKIEVEFLNPFLFLADDPAKLQAYEEYKPFIPVALYLSSRITDTPS